jgi:hypothetical protein
LTGGVERECEKKDKGQEAAKIVFSLEMHVDPALNSSQRYLKFLRLVILNLFQDLTLRTKTRC